MTILDKLYWYRCELVRVVDGDTIIVLVDQGLDQFKKMRCRLARINAPELPTAAGVESRNWLVNQLLNQELVINTKKDRTDPYGRYIVELWIGDNNVNDAALLSGHARPYP